MMRREQHHKTPSTFSSSFFISSLLLLLLLLLLLYCRSLHNISVTQSTWVWRRFKIHFYINHKFTLYYTLLLNCIMTKRSFQNTLDSWTLWYLEYRIPMQHLNTIHESMKRNPFFFSRKRWQKNTFKIK